MSEHPHTDSREPLLRIAKRDALPLWKNWAIRLAAVVLALLVCAVVVYATVKLSPLKVYAAMWSAAVGTGRRSWVTVRDSMLLLGVGIGLAPAFKMRFWNIGAEGQILIGGIVTAACMIYWGNSMPASLLLVVMFLVSALAGAVWGFIPAFFRARWNTNETLFTLMMNYVAIQLTSIIHGITAMDLPNEMVHFFEAGQIRVTSDEDIEWTLDGERAEGGRVAEMRNLHSAIQIVLPEHASEGEEEA